MHGPGATANAAGKARQARRVASSSTSSSGVGGGAPDAPQRLRGQLLEAVAVLGGEPTQLAEAAGHRHVRDRRPALGREQLAAGLAQPGFAHPAERCRAEELPEVRLQRARRHAGDPGELLQPDRLAQVGARPRHHPHHVPGHRRAGLRARRSSRVGRSAMPTPIWGRQPRTSQAHGQESLTLSGAICTAPAGSAWPRRRPVQHIPASRDMDEAPDDKTTPDEEAAHARGQGQYRGEAADSGRRHPPEDGPGGCDRAGQDQRRVLLAGRRGGHHALVPGAGRRPLPVPALGLRPAWGADHDGRGRPAGDGQGGRPVLLARRAQREGHAPTPRSSCSARSGSTRT